MTDWLTGVQALLPGVRLELLAELGGSRRSHVRRIRADATTMIVKEFTGEGDGWAREAAALAVIPPGARVPRLIAAGAVPPTVVMSDAGPGPNVADALLGQDSTVAAQAVTSWATAIGSLHRATSGSRETFADALRARAGDREPAESRVPSDLDEAAEDIARHCAELGINRPAGALDELRSLSTRLGGAGPAALTPADACPDNNVQSADGLVLIDFEGAQWRHLAWDAAYLVVPWPTCWCSWRIPADVTEQGLAAYRAANPLPYVSSPQFRRDLAAATVGWAFLSTAWFLPRALVDDPPTRDPRKPSPSLRAAVLHRLGQARESDELPALADLAGRLHEALADRWGEAILAFAPAFTRTPEAAGHPAS